MALLKELTIPRLELMSARILAQLMSTVKNALEEQVTLSGTRYWLDGNLLGSKQGGVETIRETKG